MLSSNAFRSALLRNRPALQLGTQAFQSRFQSGFGKPVPSPQPALFSTLPHSTFKSRQPPSQRLSWEHHGLSTTFPNPRIIITPDIKLKAEPNPTDFNFPPVPTTPLPNQSARTNSASTLGSLSDKELSERSALANGFSNYFNEQGNTAAASKQAAQAFAYQSELASRTALRNALPEIPSARPTLKTKGNSAVSKQPKASAVTSIPATGSAAKTTHATNSQPATNTTSRPIQKAVKAVKQVTALISRRKRYGKTYQVALTKRLSIAQDKTLPTHARQVKLREVNSIIAELKQNMAQIDNELSRLAGK